MPLDDLLFRINFSIKEENNLVFLTGSNSLYRAFSNHEGDDYEIQFSEGFKVTTLFITFVETLLISESLFYVFKINKSESSFAIDNNDCQVVSENNEIALGHISFKEELDCFVFKTQKRFFPSTLNAHFTICFSKKMINFDVLFFEDTPSSDRVFYLSYSF